MAKITEKRVFTGYGTCVIATKYLGDNRIHVEEYTDKGRQRPYVHEGDWCTWTGNGFTEVVTTTKTRARYAREEEVSE